MVCSRLPVCSSRRVMTAAQRRKNVVRTGEAELLPRVALSFDLSNDVCLAYALEYIADAGTEEQHVRVSWGVLCVFYCFTLHAKSA